MAGTNLNPGDIAFINFDSGAEKSSNDAGDTQFAFVTLTALSVGTTINFTDRGWNGTSFQNGTTATADGTLTYTATSAISAGTIVVVARDATKGGYTSLNGQPVNNPPAGESDGYAVATSGTITVVPSDQDGNFDLGNRNASPYATSSDQIFAYQGPDSNPTFIAGLATGTGFSPNGTVISDADATQSLLPGGLKLGDTAISLADTDADYFDGSLSGTAAQMRAELANTASYQEAGIAYDTADGSVAVQPGPPAISGSVSGQKTSDEAPIAPFGRVTVTDPNNGASDTLTIALAGGGGTLSGSGLAANADGTYTLTAASPQIITAEIDALSFRPAAGVPNTASTTTFTVTAASSAGAAATDSATSVVDTDSAVSPSIAGAHSTTTVSEAPVTPFSGVTVADRNGGASETLDIVLRGGGGSLSGPGLTVNADGSYSLSGTAAAVTQNLDALRFTPAGGMAGTTSTTTFTLTDASSAGPSVSDAGTSVVDVDPAADDAVSISPVVSYDDGTFTLTGTASSAAGVRSVEITAQVDGVATDLGAATVDANGNFSFEDAIGAHAQGFFAATVTDGGGGTATSADPLFSLAGGLAGGEAEQYRYTADGSAETATDLFKADGSQKASLFAPGGETFASSFFDTFQNRGAPGSTFVFDPGFGRDVVGLFRVDGTDHDTLSFMGSDYGDSVATVLASARDTAAGLLITDPVASSPGPGPGHHDTLLLKGITSGQLAANPGDVAFHA